MPEFTRTAASHHRAESPEGVALELMELIFISEVARPTRDDILSTYSQCLRATRGEYKPTGESQSGIVAAALAQ